MIERARFFLLRWRFIMRGAVLALPVLASSVFGLIWLAERNHLLLFFIACLTVALLVYISQKAALLFRKSPPEVTIDPSQGPHVTTDPDWSDAERKAFTAGQTLINERLKTPLQTEEIQDFVLQVITAVADASGTRGKAPLDFTIPEALLLVERVASRLRADLRSYLSISDRISVKTLFWIWTNQERARKIYGLGHGIYRISRFATGFHVAITREILDLVTSGNKQVLTEEVHVIAQRILFEEIAKAATELYSGRLRMSDAELLDSILADSDVDRQRLAQPDLPIRIAIAGQVSSGKSSLVNELLGRDAAEADMPPTTDRPTAHEGEIDGFPCRIIDLPGLDGTQSSTDATLFEAQQCDLLIWALPVNRPAREIDRATIEAIREDFAKQPLRIAPPLVGVATFCDQIAGATWPYPEHALPTEVQNTIGEAVRTIAQEVKIDPPVPVSLTQLPWNTDAVTAAVSRQLFTGISVQRNRIRLTKSDKSIGREAVDTVHGLTKSLRLIGKHAADRYLRDR